MKFCGIAAVAVIATAGVAKGAPRKNGGRNGNRNNNRMPNSNYNPFANKANINKNSISNNNNNMPQHRPLLHTRPNPLIMQQNQHMQLMLETLKENMKHNNNGIMSNIRPNPGMELLYQQANKNSNQDEPSDEAIDNFNQDQIIAQSVFSSLNLDNKNLNPLISETEDQHNDSSSDLPDDFQVIAKSALDNNSDSNKCSGSIDHFKVTGLCRGMFQRWSYHPDQGCVSFNYGGCGATSNNYHTKSACESSCIGQPAEEVIIKTSLNRNNNRKKFGGLASSPCDAPVLTTGWCRAYNPRWTFKDGSCVRIISGGCGADTDNNFNSEDDCKNLCLNRDAGDNYSDGLFLLDYVNEQTGCSSDPCQCPRDNGWGGPRSRVIKYYHDSISNSCHPFTYKGNGGNGNRFDSQSECESICNVEDNSDIFKGGLGIFGSIGGLEAEEELPEDPCEHPKILGPGMCRAMIPIWTFDSETGTCVSVVYGGCGTSENKFNSEEECLDMCAYDSQSTRDSSDSSDADEDSNSKEKEERCYLDFDPSDDSAKAAQKVLDAFGDQFFGQVSLTVHEYYVFDQERDRCKSQIYSHAKTDEDLDTLNVFRKFGNCMSSCKKDRRDQNAARRQGKK